jgi:hypothetical protein
MGQRKKYKYGPADIGRACGHGDSTEVLREIKEGRLDYSDLREVGEYIAGERNLYVREVLRAAKRERNGEEIF